MRILVINPGSTSTKMAVYEDETPLVLRSISHSAEELAQFDDVIEQQDYRRQLILDELRQMDIPLDFDAVIGRGGLVKPIAGGVYEINQLMLDDTHSGIALHNHACNLGCLIAHEIAEQVNTQHSSANTQHPARATLACYQRDARTPFIKPISCALYPIREKRFSDGTIALNYHRWTICECGRKKGRQLQLPVYVFLKKPLIRRFGEDWYQELCDVADALLHGVK